ncbi:MAG: MBL fold metallo-hydrolase [Gammaproteobacteria bacterium]|nr:MBL fold metallo-hydrolase [Gammaproteobacteria bacterium]
MAIDVQILGAAEEVTGSCHLVTVGDQRLLLDCGLIQGRRSDEARNKLAFPFDPKSIDAVVLSHAHIDHSGRLPVLVKAGFNGPIYSHRASRDLCRIMLKDSAFLNEKDVEWENRKRLRKGLQPIEALYTIEEANNAMSLFKGLVYGKKTRILPNVTLRLNDAGHILGSSIIELWLEDAGQARKLVFSGDLGRPGMPILQDPAVINRADLVIMESTYGDRLHRTWEHTLTEIEDVVHHTTNSRGNILIPAFAVGRTQEILYMFAKFYNAWKLDRWQVFLDSPLAIEATRVFTRHSDLFDQDTLDLWQQNEEHSMLPNLHLCRTSNQSMALNRIHSGAIIIAGSGMCSGGRIKHHLKHNIWRRECNVVISGFQAQGTLGRSLVEGARYIRLWGETVRVAAGVHTVGGLSAHADQHGLINWYSNFEQRPPVTLVHGEPVALEHLASTLEQELNAPVTIAKYGQKLDLNHLT